MISFSARDFLYAAMCLLAADAVWLTLIQNYAKSVTEKIQKSPMQIRYWAAGLVYIPLSYLVLNTKSAVHAFLTGSSVYAVYDFTSHALLKDYELNLAIADTIWGGTLFAIVHTILSRFKILSNL
jgi:uncharacterized membrane protein